MNSSIENTDTILTDTTSGDPRRDKMARIVELGHDPWGQRFDDRSSIASIRAQVDQVTYQLENGTSVDLLDPAEQPEDFNFRQWLADLGPGEMTGPKVRAAGRIVLQRDKGKLRFVDIRDMTGQIQLFIGLKQVGDENFELCKCFDLGDIVGVDGELRRTKTGELTIFAEKLHILTKSLAAPPEKHHGLKDAELRQRMRYLDLTYGEGVMERFLHRTRIVQSIRDTLGAKNFCEIEGPTLHSIAGGAAARPFTTHHNALNIDLFLRIALELHLKRCLVGGMERVYEMGRVYRNEGISPKHNPEFTMIEIYQAYGDYQTMMDLTEDLVCKAIDAISKPTDSPSGSPSLPQDKSDQASAKDAADQASHPADRYVVPWGDESIDFTPPFERRTYNDLFQEHTGLDPDDHAAIAELAAKIGIETRGRHHDVIKSDVFEEKVEDALVGPIFVTDYPSSICPLTKRKSGHPEIAERFELFVHGMEIANAYTELNDPDLQEELFQTQLKGMSDEDSMARMDHDFIRALRFGMPPAGGLGIGIDRLIMLLTNTQSIRDIILFPLLRPETEHTPS